MKNITQFSLFLALSTNAVVAQEVVSTQGESYSNGSGSIDYTIGEVVINTIDDGTHTLTQGFHQTNWNFLGLDNHSPNYSVVIFPNPTEDILNIETNMFENVTYSFFDSQGRLVLQDRLNSERTSIPVDFFSTGNYQLILKKNDIYLKTFKLVKTN